MSHFTVTVLEGNNEVSTEVIENVVEVNPSDSTNIEVIEDSTLIFVEPIIMQVEVTQETSFSIEISMGSDKFDPAAQEIPALTVDKEYSEDITQFTLVSAINATQVEISEPTSLSTATVMGIALNTGLSGVTERIHILGVLEDPSLVFAVNAPLFLGASGAVTDIPTVISGEFVVQIGYSLGNGAIFVSVSEPAEIL